MRVKRWMLTAALGSMLVGLPYVLGLFGPTEAEVRLWGLVAVVIGAILALGAAVVPAHPGRSISFFSALNYVALALLQALPIALWFVFHGTGISDGSPPSSFMAHWAYAVPHIIVLIAALGAAYHLVRGAVRSIPTGDSASRL